MLLLAVPLIAYIALFLSILLIITFYYQFRSIKKRLNDIETKNAISDLLAQELQNNVAATGKNILQLRSEINDCSLENTQVSKQLEHRIKNLQEKFQSQQVAFAQLQEQQPEDKLYSRAYKLAALGADLEEIIKECEIPRAEAEMLLSVYQKNKR